MTSIGDSSVETEIPQSSKLITKQVPVTSSASELIHGNHNSSFVFDSSASVRRQDIGFVPYPITIIFSQYTTISFKTYMYTFKKVT